MTVALWLFQGLLKGMTFATITSLILAYFRVDDSTFEDNWLKFALFKITIALISTITIYNTTIFFDNWNYFYTNALLGCLTLSLYFFVKYRTLEQRLVESNKTSPGTFRLRNLKREMKNRLCEFGSLIFRNGKIWLLAMAIACVSTLEYFCKFWLPSFLDERTFIAIPIFDTIHLKIMIFPDFIAISVVYLLFRQTPTQILRNCLSPERPYLLPSLLMLVAAPMLLVSIQDLEEVEETLLDMPFFLVTVPAISFTYLAHILFSKFCLKIFFPSTLIRFAFFLPLLSKLVLTC